MDIRDYDQVNPIQVFQVTMLALDFPLTPEWAQHIRQTDPRPFPFLSVCAVEGNMVIGQVGVFRLPVVTMEGREDVGGVWAVSTHPAYSGQGVASRLLDAAHERMRAAGLRFSTLGTQRSGVSHRLYQRHGYEDMQVWATAQASWQTAHQPTRLRAQSPGSYEQVEALFSEVGKYYLGFAWRHTPFARLRDRVSLEDIHLLCKNDYTVGYALARLDREVLKISSLLLRPGVSPAEAVAAVSARVKAAYVEVTLSRPVEMDSLRRAGFQLAHPNWSAFMIKPLTPEVTAAGARRHLGIGSDRFLISWLDTT